MVDGLIYFLIFNFIQPNPYYVIANEDLVMTRYFFFFPEGSNQSIYAKGINPPSVEK